MLVSVIVKPYPLATIASVIITLSAPFDLDQRITPREPESTEVVFGLIVSVKGSSTTFLNNSLH